MKTRKCRHCGASKARKKWIRKAGLYFCCRACLDAHHKKVCEFC